MIELNAYRRNARAPKIFTNSIGGIYRLEGGIIQVTFINKFEDLSRTPIEQGSVLWPDSNWHEYGRTLRWVQEEICRGTFRGDISQLRLQ
jgi:hypothetical protein